MRREQFKFVVLPCFVKSKKCPHMLSSLSLHTTLEPSEFYHLSDETLSEAGAKDNIPPTFDDSVELRTLGGRSYRGFSFQAEEVFDKFHKAAVSKCRVSSEEQTIIDDHFFRKSFVFPDFSKESADLQEFIASDLIDVSVKSNLEKNSE